MRPLIALLAAAVGLGAAPSAAHAAPIVARQGPATARVDQFLSATLASATPTTRLRVIIDASDPTHAEHAATSSGLRILDRFDGIGSLVAIGAPGAIVRAAHAPGVVLVEGDAPLAFTGVTSPRTTRSEDVRTGIVGTTHGTPSTRPAFDGSGVSIAVVDSGIDGTHPYFQVGAKSKVVRNIKLACPAVCEDLTDGSPAFNASADRAINDAQFVDVTAANDTDSPSAGGHGTHVAGIAAGVPRSTADGRALHGSATGAKLVGVSVGAGLSLIGADSGLAWVLRHHREPCGKGVPTTACPPIKVVNNSYGPVCCSSSTPKRFADVKDSATVRIQRALVHQGVTMVWAAGNGDEATGDGGNGTDTRTNAYSQDPTPGVLSVANYDDGGVANRDNALDPSSSRGLLTEPSTWPKISAPGSLITSACRPYLTICGSGLDAGDPNYNTISGTSMASPQVAGIVAQMIQAKRSITPAQIQAALVSTAHKFGDAASYRALSPAAPAVTSSFDKGAGLVDTAAAVARILGVGAPPYPSSSCGPAEPPIDSGSRHATGVVVDPAPAPNQPSLDIRSATAEYRPTGAALVLRIHVADLSKSPPVGSLGEYFRFDFPYGNGHYEAVADRRAGRAARFFVGTVGLATSSSAPVRGAFGVGGDRNQIEIVIPTATMRSTFKEAPITPGTMIAGMKVLAQRDIGLITATADQVGQHCSYALRPTDAP
ncbi:MAG: hypothetical protein NVS3B21_01490 [Acidimicrobiales bacterium]